MKRREFIELVAAGSLAGQASFANEVVPRQPQRVSLTFTGINGGTDATALGLVLATLVAGEVPVNLVLEADGSAEPLRAESEIASLVRRYVASFPGLIEIVAFSLRLGQLPPYKAARAAHEARKRLSHSLYSDSNIDPAYRLLTVACNAPLDSQAASATLAAGFRCVLEIPGKPVDVRRAPDLLADARLDRFGVLSLLGGEWTRFQDAAAALSRPRPGLQRHLVISSTDLTQTPVETLLQASQDIAQVIRRATLELSMISVLASDVQMRSEVGFRRRVAIHVLEPAPDAEQSETAAHQYLLRAFRSEGLPYSLGPQPKDANTVANGSHACWVPLDMPADATVNPDLVLRAFADARLFEANPGAIEADDLRFGIVVQPSRDAGTTGLTEDAVLHVPVIALLGSNPGEAPPREMLNRTAGDGVVLVMASAVQTAAERAALVVTIRKGLLQPDIRLMSLADYCAESLPKDLLLPALLLTRSKRFRKPQRTVQTSSVDRAALLEDARSAWGYFANSTANATGLCPATMISKGQPVAGHLAVSMWEVGSHINALIAAVDLGLIPDDDFSKRIERIIQTVERESRKRLVLPPETIDARTGKGTTRFNSFDTARMLIALHRLNGHRLSPKALDDLVASWTLSDIILNRRLHSFRQGKMVDDFRSNYSDYAAAGLRLWGFDVASPFDEFAGLKSADEQERLLEAIVSFGLLGAEPCMLHLLEMGSSPIPEFLADCLNTIQLRLATETRVPAAPSETPLDRSPWFTYQGFDIRSISRPWAVEIGEIQTTNDPTYDLVSVRATSTKAAYMWHALRPNEQSENLVKTLRERARKQSGFDSALYLSTRETTSGYSDLNTNAVVLQSIAHILLSRSP